MTNTVAKRGCRICGVVDSTRSHLIPAALAHDAKGGSPNLIMGTRFADGTNTTQSGIWDDDILCFDHEAMLSGADRAGIELTRFMRDEYLIIKPDSLVIEGANADQLVRFAAAVVWRCSVSDRFGVHQFNVGAAAERKLADILFRDVPIGDFPKVNIRGIKSALPHVDGLIHFPKLHRPQKGRVVRFIVGTLLFIVDVGSKPLKASEATKINGRKQFQTGYIAYETTPEWEGAVRIFEQMERKREGWPRRQKKPGTA